MNLPKTMESVKSVANAVGIQFQDRFIPILVSAIMIGSLAYYGYGRIKSLENQVNDQNTKIALLQAKLQSGGGDRLDEIESNSVNLKKEIESLQSLLGWSGEGDDAVSTRLDEIDGLIDFSTESIFRIAKHFKDVPDGYWVTSINFDSIRDDVTFKLPISIQHHVEMSIFHEGIDEDLVGERLKIDINRRDFDAVELYLDSEPRDLPVKDFFIGRRQYQEFRISLDRDTTPEELDEFRGNPLSVLVVVRRPVTIPSLVADND